MYVNKIVHMEVWQKSQFPANNPTQTITCSWYYSHTVYTWTM